MKKRILVLVAGLLAVLSVGFGSAQFSDVPAGHWAAKAVDALAAQGIIQGFPDGTFRGNENLTRYQSALVVYRLLEKLTPKEFSQMDQQTLTALRNAVQQLASELASMGVRVSLLEGNAANKADVARLQQQVAALQAKPAAVRAPRPGMSAAALKDLADRVEANAISADTSLAQAKALNSKIQQIEASVQSNSTSKAGVASLQQQLAAELASMGVRVSSLENNAASKAGVASLQQQLAALQKAVQTQSGMSAAALKSLADRVESNAISANTALAQAKALNSQAGNLSQQAQQIETSVQNNAGSIRALNDLAVILNNNVLDLKGRVSGLESTVSSLSTQVATVAKAQQQVQPISPEMYATFASKADVQAVQSYAGALRGDLVSTNGKVAALQNQIAGLSSEVTVLKQATPLFSGSLEATYGWMRTQPGTGSFDADRLGTTVFGDGDASTADISTSSGAFSNNINISIAPNDQGASQPGGFNLQSVGLSLGNVTALGAPSLGLATLSDYGTYVFNKSSGGTQYSFSWYDTDGSGTLNAGDYVLVTGVPTSATDYAVLTTSTSTGLYWVKVVGFTANSANGLLLPTTLAGAVAVNGSITNAYNTVGATPQAGTFYMVSSYNISTGYILQSAPNANGTLYVNSITSSFSIDHSPFSFTYAQAPTFEFTPYVMNNNADTLGPGLTMTMGGLPLNGTFTGVYGTDNASGSTTGGAGTNYAGMHLALAPSKAFGLGLSFANDSSNGSAGSTVLGVNAKAALGPLSFSGEFAKSGTASIYYINGGVSVGNFGVTANYRNVSPAFNGFSNDGTLSSTSPEPYWNEKGFSAGANAQLGFLSLKASFDNFTELDGASSSGAIAASATNQPLTQKSLGTSVTANLFHGFSLSGNYSKTTDNEAAGSNMTTRGYVLTDPYGSSNFTYQVGTNSPFTIAKTGFGVNLKQDGSAQNALIPNLSLAAGYSQTRYSGINTPGITTTGFGLTTMSVSASYGAKLGAFSFTPSVGYTKNTYTGNANSTVFNAAGIATPGTTGNTNQLSYGLGMSTAPLALPFAPSFSASYQTVATGHTNATYTYDPSNAHISTVASYKATKTTSSFGLMLNEFFAKGSQLGVKYMAAKGSNYSFSNAADASGTSGSTSGIYTTWSYYDLNMAYGTFSNTVSSTPTTYGQAFKASYTLKF